MIQKAWAAFKITKIQIFSYRKETCSSVWSYDKNISTLHCSCLLYFSLASGITNGRNENRRLIEIGKTFAHEVGHILGIYHDFDSNQNVSDIARNQTCGPAKWDGGYDNQIMNYGNPRQPTWSDCSNEDFQNYYKAITSLYGRFCLKGL